MLPFTQLKSLILACASSVSFLCLFTGLFTSAQAQLTPHPTSIGSSGCLNCHSNPFPLNNVDGDNADGLEMQQARLFLGRDTYGNPLPTPADPHAEALSKILLSDGTPTPLTSQIINEIGITAPSDAFSKTCLTCHAGFQYRSNPTQESLTLALGRSAESIEEDLQTPANKSIGCEACHGAASNYFQPHQTKRWLGLSADNKSQQGFFDLANPAIAAEVCLSCHLGSPSESKVVSHRIYAAGHPPLPPFDLAKSLDATCNQHWVDLKVKATLWKPTPVGSNDPRKNYLLAHFQASATDADALKSEIANHFDNTLKSFIGIQTAQAMNLKLIHNQATKGEWGDYASYDCMGCHQTLYKQIRSSTSIPNRIPGRPLWAYWTRLPDSVSLINTTPLDEAFLAQPFGNPNLISKALDASLNYPSTIPTTESSANNPSANPIDQSMKRLQARAREPMTRVQAQAWIRSLLTQRKDFLGNEWVAKQTLWALEMYFKDIETCELLNPNSPKIDPEIQAAFRALQQQSRSVWSTNACTPTTEPQEAPPREITAGELTQRATTAKNHRPFGNQSHVEHTGERTDAHAAEQTGELIEALRDFIDAYLASSNPYAGSKN